ncbi:MAG: ester cyclase [Thermoplasmata archaeon]|nr:MAG: ester cyclase [Thermoplasmata archaeon]
MSAEENKAIINRLFEEIWKKKNLKAADELVAMDAVDHNPMAPGLPQGLEGSKKGWSMVHSAFPDIDVTIKDQIADEGKVVSRATMQGIHKGEFMGIPPTGKKVTAEVIDIVRIEEGKIVERWGLVDMLDVMQQLGIVPPPPPPQ